MLELARAEAPGPATSSSRARRSRSTRARCRPSSRAACSPAPSSPSCSSRRTRSSTPAVSGTSRRGVEFHGESAHSARPWTGRNAIHALAEGLAPLARLEPLEVELDGLVYREVLSAVRVEGGIAQNVVPARASAELNFRFAPGRSREEAEARLRELVPARRAARPPQLAVGAAGAREPARGAAARARAGGRAEAGVDAGRAVRRAGHRRRSTTAPARRRTRTGRTSRSRSRTCTRCTTRWLGSSA